MAAPLARAGRRVVVLDRMGFPSDQLSTHVLMPAGTSELAKLVGADGRRSTVAALAGAWTPYRISRNGRGLVFRYLLDPLAGGIEAETLYQWREGDSFAFAFPSTPVGRLLVLFMGHRDEVRDARAEPEATGSASSPSIRASRRAWRARWRGRGCARRARRRRSSARPPVLAGRWPETRDTSRTRSRGGACATRCSRGVRVAPASARELAAGPDGLEVLALGTHSPGDGGMVIADE